MKHRKLVRVTPLVLACTLWFLSACHHVGSRSIRSSAACRGRQDAGREAFTAPRLAAIRSTGVFLPATLAAGQKLPVVYLLHSAGDGFRDWSNETNVAQYAQKRILLVMPEGNSSYYVNAVGVPKDRYEDYITRDLIADVEARFPARNDREHRASDRRSPMGGFAAIELCVDTFSTYLVSVAP